MSYGVRELSTGVIFRQSPKKEQLLVHMEETITSSILGVLVLCSGSGQTLAGGLHLILSAHFSAAIVSCPIHIITFINT